MLSECTRISPFKIFSGRNEKNTFLYGWLSDKFLTYFCRHKGGRILWQIRSLRSLLRPHLSTGRADFWHVSSILLGLHLKLAIVELGLHRPSSSSIRPFNCYSGGGDGLRKPNAAIANFRCSPNKIVATYQKSARFINKCGQSRLYRILSIYLGP